MPTSAAETNIHIRVRAADRDLIDRAAEAAGVNRSQFMLASSLREATNLLLDQTNILVDQAAFQAILDRLDRPASSEETDGFSRLSAARADWARE